jgi:20S proteasome alpha/beta subunit
MNRKIKLLALFDILVAFFVPCARAQKQTTGTIIVFGISNQFITAAADSRMVEVNTEQRKTKCKITALGDKSVFSVSGMKFLR